MRLRNVHRADRRNARHELFSRNGAHVGGRYATCLSDRRSWRTETMASTRFDRRTFLQRAAVGAAALPAMGALTSARGAAARAAQAVELEFWTPGQRPGRQQDHHRPGRGLQQHRWPGARDPRQHPHQAGYRRRLHPVHDGDDLLRLPGRGDDLRLLPRRSPGPPTASSSRSTSTRRRRGSRRRTSSRSPGR